MKKHFEILDGLRGIVAIYVVLFHIIESNNADYTVNLFHHGYLGVDFFFMLSGFVMGYAYDDRWSYMSLKEFFIIRLIRLHPLVLLGIIIGAVGYWVDPFTGDA